MGKQISELPNNWEELLKEPVRKLTKYITKELLKKINKENKNEKTN